MNYDFVAVDARVKAGAELLDEKLPGWRDQIAPGELKMSDCGKCVLGQTMRDYDFGRRELDLTSYEASMLGFNTLVGQVAWDEYLDDESWERVGEAVNLEWNLLEEAWLREVKGE